MRLKFLGSPQRTLPVPPLWLLKPLTDPIDALLTLSVRRLAVKRPDVFRRLGRFQQCAFLISPTDLSFAFKLIPSSQKGSVQIVPKELTASYSVKISGKLLTLIGLFDGTIDADSSFFGGDIRVEGATDAALALHNALEAAELSASDILGVPSQLKILFDKMFATLIARAGHDFA